jgi:hypothetical protein
MSSRQVVLIAAGLLLALAACAMIAAALSLLGLFDIPFLSGYDALHIA